MERLGEVPVAVVEKAKTCGGHNLSGAVMRPGPLQELFPEISREDWRKEGFAFGEVKKEAVYMTPTAKTKLRIPPPPPFKNHGNEVVSVSAMARFQQRQAEEAGAYILTETAATQLVVEDGRVVGVRSGDKGRGKDGEPLGNFEPGTDIKARATVLAEGCWGHLTGAAIREFDLAEGREPQVWELGVKEVWKVPKPLDRLIHTIGPWPLKVSSKYGQIGGTWIYPMKDEKTGEDLVSIGFVIDLEYARRDDLGPRPAAAVQAAPARQGHPRGRRARRVGSEGAAGRRLLVDAEARDAGGRARRRRRRDGRHGRPEGRPPLDHVGQTGCRVDLRGARPGRDELLFLRTDDRGIDGRQRALRGPQHAPALPDAASCREARSSNLAIATKGKLPPGRLSWHRNDAKPMFVGKTKDSYPKPDGKYTFDKLSSVFITGNATRDDAPNHIRVQKHVPREIAETWRWMCPAGVYEIPDDAPEHGPVDVIVNYTNCVQCGAITAKGGRLTTPEGGDGPLYQLT